VLHQLVVAVVLAMCQKLVVLVGLAAAVLMVLVQEVLAQQTKVWLVAMVVLLRTYMAVLVVEHLQLVLTAQVQ
jgi:hypothetical protein